MAAFLLVNNAELVLSNPGSTHDHHVHVNTVRDNYEGFSRNQIKQATIAQQLMGMVATLSTHDFQGLVCLNLLKDCPVTNDDIKNAHAIFGPNLASIRGKMIWCKLATVGTDYVDILRALINVHSCIMVAVDIMFVSRVPSLVSVLHNINLITIEHAPQRHAPKLGYLIHQIIRTYACVDFTVQTLLMDNEFEKVQDHVPMLNFNTSATDEHVGKVEHRIWVI